MSRASKPVLHLTAVTAVPKTALEAVEARQTKQDRELNRQARDIATLKTKRQQAETERDKLKLDLAESKRVRSALLKRAEEAERERDEALEEVNAAVQNAADYEGQRNQTEAQLEQAREALREIMKLPHVGKRCNDPKHCSGAIAEAALTALEPKP